MKQISELISNVITMYVLIQFRVTITTLDYSIEGQDHFLIVFIQNEAGSKFQTSAPRERREASKVSRAAANSTLKER